MIEPVKVAAIQMCAEFGNVEVNLRKAEALLTDALDRGAKWAILPEFFTSGVGFHPKILEVAMPVEGPALILMRRLACKYHAWVGGSFICRRNDHNYNTFFLVSPDGTHQKHDKDLPTMWENCYYRRGEDNGILDSPVGNVGAALCWEFIRTQTVRRLRGQVAMVVGGTCWWDLPKKRLGLPKSLAVRNLKILQETPSRFARLVGAPVVHASQAGSFSCKWPLVPGVPYESHYLGETQIVDAKGGILARLTRENGDGVITAAITPGNVAPSEELRDRYWIPDLPGAIRFFWSLQNAHGKRYYRQANARGLFTTYEIQP